MHRLLVLLDAPPACTGPIDCRAVEDVRKDPYSLPASFQWSDLNLDNDEEVKELYTLLHENYVEDGDAAGSRSGGGGGRASAGGSRASGWRARPRLRAATRLPARSRARP